MQMKKVKVATKKKIISANSAKKSSKSPSLGKVKKSIKKMVTQDIEKQMKKMPMKDITSEQMGKIQNTYRELEAEFQQNLARIYNKAAHKSGVVKCHQLIEQNCNSPEVVTIFLNAMSNKNLL